MQKSKVVTFLIFSFSFLLWACQNTQSKPKTPNKIEPTSCYHPQSEHSSSTARGLKRKDSIKQQPTFEATIKLTEYTYPEGRNFRYLLFAGDEQITLPASQSSFALECNKERIDTFSIPKKHAGKVLTLFSEQRFEIPDELRKLSVSQISAIKPTAPEYRYSPNAIPAPIFPGDMRTLKTSNYPFQRVRNGIQKSYFTEKINLEASTVVLAQPVGTSVDLSLLFSAFRHPLLHSITCLLNGVQAPIFPKGNYSWRGRGDSLDVVILPVTVTPNRLGWNRVACYVIDTLEVDPKTNPDLTSGTMAQVYELFIYASK
jgi:hypothetical protein